jgi:hypothetical protein
LMVESREALCWTKARKGARPPPAQIVIMGVVDGDADGLKKAWPGLRVTWRVAPAGRRVRKCEARPNWCCEVAPLLLVSMAGERWISDHVMVHGFAVSVGPRRGRARWSRT